MTEIKGINDYVNTITGGEFMVQHLDLVNDKVTGLYRRTDTMHTVSLEEFVSTYLRHDEYPHYLEAQKDKRERGLV